MNDMITMGINEERTYLEKVKVTHPVGKVWETKLDGKRGKYSQRGHERTWEKYEHF
jgi:hypothetical protein